MSPDKSHLHHKLLNLGYSKTQALYLIAFIQTLLCLVVVLSSFLGNLRGSTVLFEALVFMVIFFSVIHYTNRAVNRKNNALFGPIKPEIEAEEEKPEEAKTEESKADETKEEEKK